MTTLIFNISISFLILWMTMLFLCQFAVATTPLKIKLFFQHIYKRQLSVSLQICFSSVFFLHCISNTDEGRRQSMSVKKLKVVIYVLKLLTSLLLNRPFGKLFLFLRVRGNYSCFACSTASEVGTLKTSYFQNS